MSQQKRSSIFCSLCGLFFCLFLLAILLAPGTLLTFAPLGIYAKLKPFSAYSIKSHISTTGVLVQANAFDNFLYNGTNLKVQQSNSPVPLPSKVYTVNNTREVRNTKKQWVYDSQDYMTSMPFTKDGLMLYAMAGDSFSVSCDACSLDGGQWQMSVQESSLFTKKDDDHKHDDDKHHHKKDDDKKHHGKKHNGHKGKHHGGKKLHRKMDKTIYIQPEPVMGQKFEEDAHPRRNAHWIKHKLHSAGRALRTHWRKHRDHARNRNHHHQSRHNLPPHHSDHQNKGGHHSPPANGNDKQGDGDLKQTVLTFIVPLTAGYVLKYSPRNNATHFHMTLNAVRTQYEIMDENQYFWCDAKGCNLPRKLWSMGVVVPLLLDNLVGGVNVSKEDSPFVAPLLLTPSALAIGMGLICAACCCGCWCLCCLPKYCRGGPEEYATLDEDTYPQQPPQAIYPQAYATQSNFQQPSHGYDSGQMYNHHGAAITGYHTAGTSAGNFSLNYPSPPDNDTSTKRAPASFQSAQPVEGGYIPYYSANAATQ